MNHRRRFSQGYWTVNLVLTLTITVGHFCLYTSLRGMAFAAGEGGHRVPAWLSWPVIALGFPMMPVGSYLLVLLPHWIHSSQLGRDGMGFIYLLSGINAALCGAWTTVQARVVPTLVRFLHRAVTERLASLGVRP